jgi:parallel beta-helix repeat protein
VAVFGVVLNVPVVWGSGTIYIRADGSIDPPTAPISTVDNITYTFTDNIVTDPFNDGIMVQRSNITIDGDGYTLQRSAGGGSNPPDYQGFYLSGVNNVTIKNTKIQGFSGCGVFLSLSHYNVIFGNNITGNDVGIYLRDSSNNNTISRNNITNSKFHGISVDYSSNNNTVFGNKISNNIGYGVSAWSSSYNNISGNNITNNSRGISLESSSNNNRISGNNVTYNNVGVYLDQSSYNNFFGNNITYNYHSQDGFSLFDSSYNTILENNITNNIADGILIAWGSFYNTISKNNIANNKKSGVDLFMTEYNTVFGNNISNNNVGINLYYSQHNKFYHNNLINNTNQARIYGAYYGYYNVLDDGYPSGGNYWSDYTGADLFKGPFQNETGSDGIGDTPYNQDNYPLMHSWSFLPIHNINTGLGYTKIQEAIDANKTLDGHTVFVEAKIYYENIVVSKTLSFIGESRETTIIDGNGVGNVIEVAADHVTITGFTIRNSSLAWQRAGIILNSSNNMLIENKIVNNGDGIWLWNSSDNTVLRNNITNNYGTIRLYSSFNNIIADNDITNNYGGFSLSGSSYNSIGNNKISANKWNGIALYESSNNTIMGNNVTLNDADGIYIGYSSNNNTVICNNIEANKWCGIYIYEQSKSNVLVDNNMTLNERDGITLDPGSINNTISNNNIATNNLYGILISQTSSYNTLTSNNIVNNGDGGIMLVGSNNKIKDNNIISNGGVGIRQEYSAGNLIFHNNFINNTLQVFSYLSMNIWNDSYPSGGNYWDDYTGVDEKNGPNQDQLGSDGIGDTPYVIDGNNRDNYPFMYPFGPDQIPPTTINDYDGLWYTVDFRVNLTATDVWSGVAETYYKINDESTKTVGADGQPLITTEGANNKLEYWSVDNAGNEELPHKILTEIKLDKTVPIGSITINNDASYTTSTSVTLTLTADDATSGVYQMRFSNDGITWTDWEDYTTSKSWTLPLGDGTKTVYVQFRDHAGLISTYSDTITLDTTSPTGSISIAGDAAYTNSSVVTLTLSATDATSGVAQMRFSNDNVTWSDWEPYATSKSWTLLTGDGLKGVTVQYKDNAGLISSYGDSIILDTIQPTAKAGNDQTVNEDTQVAFDGSASTDENGISTYTWTFTDLTPQTLTGKNPTCTFTTPGTYTITLKVTDPAGNSATDTVIITVLDVTKPTADAGSDRTVNEDTSITLDGSASSDNGAITAYTWTFTDVTVKTLTGAKPTYTFNTPGVYTITLNVTDSAGNWATDTVIITVLDITKPAANAGQDQTVNVGATVTFDAGGSTDNVGIVSYEWDFGDGTTGIGKTTTHTYTTAGNYTVTLTVKDAAGNYATDSITITVLATEGTPMWIIGVAVAAVALAIAAAATIVWKKRK